MSPGRSQNHWLPYLVIIIGIVISGFLWYVFQVHLHAYTDFIISVNDFLPWFVFSLGIAISILIGSIIRFAQLAHKRTLSLNKANIELKREIADRIQAQEIKQKMEIGLQQGQKLQAMGTLAGGIAHDFNNILYAIKGYIEMAREDVPADSIIYKNLGRVLEAASRGQELVSRILSFSRRQHHELSPLNLKETIEAALALLQPTIPASVMIDFEPKGNCMILGNQTLLHQILVNLINNAVDAMDGEGTVRILMSRIAANSVELRRQFPQMPAQNYCKIDIIDTGHGMDQHTMERIFEPFFTTKEVGKGTGLGLSIVHTIIKEHQGEIAVKSQLGHGATFSLLLPEYKASKEEEQKYGKNFTG